jgi:integrase
MPKGVSGGWKATLAKVLKDHNSVKANGSVAGAATQDKRSDVLFSGFKLLRELGYKLNDVHGFGGRHIAALAQYWESRNLSPSTIQNNISIFRRFAEWIGKAGLVEASSKYVSDDVARRSSINKSDKSWPTRGVEIDAKISEVTEKDARIGLQLRLQHLFGLRPREAMQLRPHLADHGTYLAVSYGTKGGRDRVVAIDTPEKRKLLDEAKTFASSRMASTSDPRLTLAQVKARYYSVVRACGIRRENGITSYGLRHKFANDRFQELTGEASPVRGGALAASDPERDHVARVNIAEELGHSRESITTYYLGR